MINTFTQKPGRFAGEAICPPALLDAGWLRLKVFGDWPQDQHGQKAEGTNQHHRPEHQHAEKVGCPSKTRAR